ncbi:MAG TPA: GGDEF domain-containing protein [Steroidobacteraceae bacterium]|nr:GGDEF domain-containing protein [Steroidobacteraceae bacterium]
MALIDATPGMVMVSSSQGRLLYMNGVGRQMLGIGSHTSIAARTVFDIYSPQSCDTLLDEAIPTCLRSGIWRGEMTLLDSASVEVPVSQVLMAHRVREQHGRETTTLSSIAWDIREMKDIERQLRHQATHDALTGLPNRMLLLDRLEHAIVVAERKGGAVGVLFLDLDGFKQVNDTLGHEMANQLLCALGRRLAARVRAEDTIARYGGDEFVLVIPDLATPEDTTRVTQQVRQAVEETFAMGREMVRLQASIGVAVYPHDGRDAGALLRRADGRMYEQKSRARGEGPADGHPPGGDPLAAA